MRKADVALSVEMLERVELSSKLAISFDVVAVLVMFGCVRLFDIFFENYLAIFFSFRVLRSLSLTYFMR